MVRSRGASWTGGVRSMLSGLLGFTGSDTGADSDVISAIVSSFSVSGLGTPSNVKDDGASAALASSATNKHKEIAKRCSIFYHTLNIKV